MPNRQLLIAAIVQLIVAVSSLQSVATLSRNKNANPNSILWPNAESDPQHQQPLPPGSFGCPFIGSNIFQGDSVDGPETFYQSKSKSLGNPALWKFYFVGNPAIMVADPNNLRSLMKEEFHTLSSPKAFRFLKDPLAGDHSNIQFVQDRALHKAQRQAMQKSMQPGAISRAIPMMQARAEASVESLLNNSSQGEVRMADIAAEYMISISQDLVLGQKGDECRTKYVAALRNWALGLGIVSFSEHNCIFAKMSRLFKAVSGVFTVKASIEQRIREMEISGKEDGTTLSDLFFATKDDGSRLLTEREVLQNAMMLAFASYENSTHILTLALLMLGLNPQARQKLAREQASVREFHGEKLSAEALDACTYLDCVVKETLRMGPLAILSPRKIQETTIVNGQQIPKGWSVVGGIRQIHAQDPKTWQEDGSHMDVRKGFRPERWLCKETRPTDHYMPFGAGPRYCFGSKLAVAEIKTFLAVMMRSGVTDWDLVNPNVEWQPSTAIRSPSDGLQVNLRSLAPK